MGRHFSPELLQWTASTPMLSLTYHAGRRLVLTGCLKNSTYNICDPDNSEENQADCCQASWEWSTCFLKLGIRTGYNRTTISQDTCAYSPILRDGILAPSIVPQVRYILLNISYVHAFFDDWYTSVNNAAGTPASNIIDAVIQEVDPEVKTKFKLTNILTALVAGLAFVPGAGAGAQVTTKIATQALVTGVQQVPGTAKALWPTGTLSANVQISNLKQGLAAASSALKNRMNAGLHEVMYNKASFADFASSGLFSGADDPSIPDNEDALTMGFRTFLVTRALSENKFHGRVYPAGGRLWFRHQCVPNAPPDDSGALCWYNATTQRVYDIDKVENDQSWQLSRDIIEKHWADYPFMFEGSVE
ncbi:MAG: hypothetical protein Q9226_008546 [Calogaya cf. arnoldii]